MDYTTLFLVGNTVTEVRQVALYRLLTALIVNDTTVVVHLSSREAHIQISVVRRDVELPGLGNIRTVGLAVGTVDTDDGLAQTLGI